MFPPKKTLTAEKWLEGLCLSLHRAEVPVGAGGQVQHLEKGVNVELPLTGPMTAKVAQALRSYIAAYAKGSGWKTTGLRIQPRCVAFGATIAEAPAASRSASTRAKN